MWQGSSGMALVSVSMEKAGWRADTDLSAALEALPANAAVTVMVHGFRFSPAVAAHDPHRHILSLAPPRGCWKAASWPRHLHLDRPGAGLGIGFGWHARGRLDRVAARAFEAGDGLAGLIGTVGRHRPDLQVNVIAHSLGARVALAALAGLPAGRVDRVILLSGAEYRDLARAAMDSPAGRAVQVLNVSSGENAPFDALFRLCVPAPRLTDWPLSAGLRGLPGWTDLRVDCPQSLAVLRHQGFPTRAPATRVCHWSTYLRPGLFRLYRAVCAPGPADLLPRLSAALPRSSPPRRGIAVPRLRPASPHGS
jgi:pimeloyl-ACP methyl ester carboxylesterase